ncbi:PAS domain-containing protein [Pelagibius marinus]|uniref:PAS domain-containing protein n=1 Tax=Pelagibius marinus TaxID=2762760 RepID=UPI0018724099|nr:PAS domain-containing protein [Pelagibius marinus]
MDLKRLTLEEALEAAPDFRGMLEVWSSKRRDEQIPGWSDFDFPDFVGWHSDLVLSIFKTEEPDPYFVLSGETFTRAIDFNVKGVHFSQGWPRLFDLQFREHFGAIRDTGLIGLTEGKVATSNRNFLSIRVLELPVRDGGDEVQRMIHVVRVLSD